MRGAAVPEVYLTITIRSSMFRISAALEAAEAV